MFKVTSMNTRSLALLQVVLMVVAVLVPLLASSTPVSASQLTSRNVTISDSDFGATGVTYEFDFHLVTVSGNIGSMKIQACLEAVTGCTAPTNFDWDGGGTYTPTDTGWDGGTSFTRDGTGALDCTAAANVACLTRTAAAEDDTATREIDLAGVTNGDDTGAANAEVVFFRVTLYSDAGYTAANVVDNGTSATAWVNDITVNATVEETLTFCVFTGANCAAGGDTVDLGVLSTGSTVTDATLTFDLGANANGGTTVQYVSSGDITSGSNTITTAGLAGTLESAGTQEMFGFCVQNFGGTGAAAGVAPYNTDCDDAGSNDRFVFNNSPTVFDVIADTAGGASDDDTFDAKFGADIQITTESGVYSTNLTFVAIPTY